jgi:DNA-binding XRE family transcriptional regulator
MIIRSPEDVGILLKNLRKEHKISQKTLAKGIGISEFSIMRYEKNSYLQASSEIVFSVLAYFTREHVKDTLHLSIISQNDTMNTDSNNSSDIR